MICELLGDELLVNPYKINIGMKQEYMNIGLANVFLKGNAQTSNHLNQRLWLELILKLGVFNYIVVLVIYSSSMCYIHKKGSDPLESDKSVLYYTVDTRKVL